MVSRRLACSSCIAGLAKLAAEVEVAERLAIEAVGEEDAERRAALLSEARGYVLSARRRVEDLYRAGCVGRESADRLSRRLDEALEQLEREGAREAHYALIKASVEARYRAAEDVAELCMGER